MNTEKKLESKLLAPCDGFVIEKSWEVFPDGKVDKESIVYTAYTSDEANALVDADKNLKELKKKIRN